MIVQIMGTAFLVMIIATMAFHFHSAMGHNPPDWVKVIEIIVWFGSIAVMFCAAFYWIWN